MLHDVKIVNLKSIHDERGKVMHMLKRTDEHYTEFGEIYFSCAWPGVIKAWHTHKSMTLNNAVIQGNAKLVMYDLRKESKTYLQIQEIFLGEDNYKLVQIPPGIANGYKPYGNKLCILANCASEPHSKDEISYIDPFDNDIPYNWEIQNR